MREIGGAGKESQEYGEKGGTSLYQRDSSLCLHSTQGEVKSATGYEEVPALRNSKLVHTFDRREGRWVVVHSDYYKRYGGKRELILRDVLAGAHHEVAELREKYGAKTGGPGRFFKTWIKPMIDDGVLVGDSGIVGAAPDWRAALERVRDRTLEKEDDRRQSEKYAERRRKYLRAKDTKADPTPESRGPDETRRIVRASAEREEESRIEEQRSKAGVTVETFIHDTLTRMGKIRMGLLQDLWLDKGGDRSHVWFGVRRLGCKTERLPEHDNEVFVFPRIEREYSPEPENPAGPDMATVVDLLDRLPEESQDVSESPPKLPPPEVEGVFVHGPLCECDWCEDEYEPSYARPVGSKA